MICDNWFKDAKYGLFIHWGIYALLGGVYRGEKVPYGAEWIMKNAGIPFEEYRKLAEIFNPVAFDAGEIVRKAKSWGMKYIVFTAKHHDGFAMYDSKVSDYSIMNTPFKRDPLKELSRECQKQGIVLGIYYSQMQDWEDENGWGNDWDFKPDKEKNFQQYFRGKVLPQVKELLSNYGNIGMMWFDTPYVMPMELCRELKEFTKSLQPECLVNGRIGYKLGDYRQMSDNEIPVLSFPGNWETPMTLNETWGYSSVDNSWKSASEVLYKLVDVVGKGGNLLLNIGPDEKGSLPAECEKVLNQVGKWFEVSGESIYDCNLTLDFQYQIGWGKVTARNHKMFLHVFKYPRFPYEILITGLKTKIDKVYMLKNKKALRFFQSYEPARDEYRFRVLLPDNEDIDLDMELYLVICAEYQGEIEIQKLD